MFYVNARAFIERCSKEKTSIIIQTRTKKNEAALELPGGRLELYESIYDGLKREVFEETGLTITEIEGSQKRIDTCGINHNFEVECVEPYCVYQTIKGPVDSVGMYFICRAEGRLLIEGDDTANIRWISIEEVHQMMLDDPLQFSNVDRAGLQYYLQHRFDLKL